jgi:mannonate dehydratase
MKLSFLFFSDIPDVKWELVRQMGIKYAIAKLAPELTSKSPPWEFASLKESKERFAQYGFDWIGLEGDQMDMSRIKLGLPGRDEDIKKYKMMIRNIGKLNINLLCYNFIVTGWFRSKKDIIERSGALVTGYNADDAKNFRKQFLEKYRDAKSGRITPIFINAVMPVAEEAGVKMALHPDDPPVVELQNIDRIFINADAVRRALFLVDSRSHGITFCQGTFLTMGEDIEALIDEFGSKEKIFFVHIRDVEGNASSFKETFHDNGPTKMPDMFKRYKDIHFDGALRSDHVPTMAGEDNNRAGYGMSGNLFGIGYIKGIMDSLNISYE